MAVTHPAQRGHSSRNWHSVQTISQICSPHPNTSNCNTIARLLSTYPSVPAGPATVPETHLEQDLANEKNSPSPWDTQSYFLLLEKVSEKRCSALGVETELEEHSVQIPRLWRNPLYANSLKWSQLALSLSRGRKCSSRRINIFYILAIGLKLFLPTESKYASRKQEKSARFLRQRYIQCSWHPE